MTDTVDKFTAWVLKVCGTLIAAGILSTAALLYHIGAQLAVLQDQMARMEARTSGLYTESQAERDLGGIRDDIRGQRVKLEDLDRRLGDLERGFR